jgi:hypothetical protein
MVVLVVEQIQQEPLVLQRTMVVVVLVRELVPRVREVSAGKVLLELPILYALTQLQQV